MSTIILKLFYLFFFFYFESLYAIKKARSTQEIHLESWKFYLFAFVSSSDYTYKTKTVFLQFLVSQGKKADALLKYFFFSVINFVACGYVGSQTRASFKFESNQIRK